MKLFSVFLFLILVGCDSSEKTDTDVAEEELDTMLDPLSESLQKAGEVEDIVMQQKLKMDAALRQMEGERDDPEE